MSMQQSPSDEESAEDGREQGGSLPLMLVVLGIFLSPLLYDLLRLLARVFGRR